MTVLQMTYRELRVNGLGHLAALKAMSRRYALDAGTIARTLKKAEAFDARNG